MGLLIRFARQWVAGERMEDALRAAAVVNVKGVDAVVNHLGEHYRERARVDATLQEDLGPLGPLVLLFGGGRLSGGGSHDGRMIERALELSRIHDAPFEFQMLQGVRDSLKAELVRRSFHVAEYIPYGPAWLSYFSRRLRERPRNG